MSKLVKKKERRRRRERERERELSTEGEEEKDSVSDFGYYDFDVSFGVVELVVKIDEINLFWRFG
ncbi:hypothetical protein ACOSP7_022193 [Xanthoceras sorbifolium]